MVSFDNLTPAAIIIQNNKIMPKIINIPYSFIRKESDNSIVLIIDMQSEWIEKEIDFRLIENKLEIFFENQEENSSSTIWYLAIDNPMVLEHLKFSSTAIIINGENDGIAELIVKPLSHTQLSARNKIKSAF